MNKDVAGPGVVLRAGHLESSLTGTLVLGSPCVSQDCVLCPPSDGKGDGELGAGAKTGAFEADAAVWAQTGKCDCGMLWKRQLLGAVAGRGRVCP